MLKRLEQKSSSRCLAALAPGTRLATGATVRSTLREASAASQSTCSEGSCLSIALRGGMSFKNSPYWSVILLRMVLAAVSCLSEACQTGTTLCASTCTQHTLAAPNALAASAVQARGTRNGDMSHTTVATCLRSHSPSSTAACFPYSHISSSKGMLSSRSSASTSRRPRSMKSNCRMVASRKVGTKQKATQSFPPDATARSRAWRSAQLSCTRWSRDIQ
mmetsp:Transcript_106525/g.311403  ORF Transcript_106525/g.311403 Transcript_106525/m.311403 type:complete len:219 (+) Transcript_106525:858-1514(+)